MKQHGPCIYFDTSTKGSNGKRHNTYRADITINGIRYRRRNKRKTCLVRWLKGLGIKA